MTVGEINQVIKAKEEQKMDELRLQAMMDYKLSECITIGIGCMMNKGNKPQPLYDIYPTLFKEQKEKADELKQKTELEIYKENFRRRFKVKKKEK